MLVVGSGVGVVIVEGSYGGDMNNRPSSGTVQLIVAATGSSLTSTAVTCTPSSLEAGGLGTCTTKVTGSNPTGTVFWSQVGSGTVTFGASSCTLSLGSCSMSATGSGVGAVSVKASYGGDANNGVSSGTASLTVTKSLTVTGVSCTPVSVLVGGTSTCTVTVLGFNPTGIVSWSQTTINHGAVTFSSSTCTLTAGSCSVTANGAANGALVVQASYGGDSNNQVSSGTTTLTVKP